MDIADYPVGLQERPLFYGLRGVVWDCIGAARKVQLARRKRIGVGLPVSLKTGGRIGLQAKEYGHLQMVCRATQHWCGSRGIPVQDRHL